MRISDWSSDVCSSDLAGDDTVARFENGQRTASVKVGDRPEAIALGKQLLWVATRNDGTANRVDRAGPEERRVGKEGVRTCGSGWSRCHSKTTKHKEMQAAKQRTNNKHKQEKRT